MKPDVLAEINAMRESYGMRPILPARRKCLRCDQEFNSSGIDNRICPTCWADPDYGPWMESHPLPRHLQRQITRYIDKYMAGKFSDFEIDTTLMDKEEF